MDGGIRICFVLFPTAHACTPGIPSLPGVPAVPDGPLGPGRPFNFIIKVNKQLIQLKRMHYKAKSSQLNFAICYDCKLDGAMRSLLDASTL